LIGYSNLAKAKKYTVSPVSTRVSHLNEHFITTITGCSNRISSQGEDAKIARDSA
jgi:hypothetical protein